ncbi:MAG: hypothetical protein ACPHRO_11385, partial [Nannocystaceae bacterium]
ASLLAAERGTTETGTLPYLRLARWSHVTTILLGGAVFAVARHREIPFAQHFFESPGTIACLSVATVMILVVAWSYGRAAIGWLRVAVAVQTTAIVAGFAFGQLPVLVHLHGGETITYLDGASSDAARAPRRARSGGDVDRARYLVVDARVQVVTLKTHVTCRLASSR